MARFTVEINDVEEKALLTVMISIQEWIDNAIHNRARIAINTIVEETTDKRAGALSVEAKQTVVRNAVVETAAEKQAKYFAKMAKLST